MSRAAAAARIGACCLIVMVLMAQAHAAEIKVLSSNATKTLLEPGKN